MNRAIGARACAFLLAVLLLAAPASPAFALGSSDIVWLTSVGFTDNVRGWMSVKWNKSMGTAFHPSIALDTEDGGRTWRPRLFTSFAGLAGLGDLAVLPGGNAKFLAPETGGMWSTSSGGTSWANKNLPVAATGHLTFKSIAFTTPLDGWAVGYHDLGDSAAVIYRTVDGGVRWTRCYEGPVYYEGGVNPNPTAYADFKSVAVRPGSLAAIAVGGRSSGGTYEPFIMRTTNGSSWTTLSVTVPSSGASVSLFGVTCLDASHAWAVGSGGVVLRFNGSGWSVVRPFRPGGMTDVNGLNAVDAVDASRVWAVGNNGTLIRSTDGGSNWTAGNLGSDKLLAVDFTDATHGWVTGRNKTLWYTTDGGAHWTKWSPMRRLSGTDRYATSVATSKDAFKAGASNGVVLAFGKGYQDALIGSGLAGSLKGPLLLSSIAGPTAAVKTEIKRVLGPPSLSKRVYVLGVLPATIEGPLRSLGYTVKGLHGKSSTGANDYFKTAKLVATEIKSVKGAVPSTAFVARFDSYADALSASALAAAQGFPILLTPSTSLSASVRETITGLGIKNVVIVGGTGVVSSGVETSLKGLKVGTTSVKVVRAYGSNRWTTATAVANYGVSKGWVGANVMGVAYGRNFPDALGAGVALGAEGGVLLLTELRYLPSGTGSYLDWNGGGVFWMSVFGGTGAVGSGVYSAIAGKL